MCSVRMGLQQIAGLALLITLACATTAAHGQERAQPIRKQELWVSLEVKGRLPKVFKDLLGKDLYKRFKLDGELAYRSADVFYAPRQVYTDLGASFKLNSHFNIGAVHRISFRPEDNTKHRTSLQLNYETKWKRFDLEYRLSYQHNYTDLGSQREMIRNKFSVGYDFQNFKFDPEISTEFFTWVGYQGIQYTGTRQSIGTSYSLSKAHKISFKMIHDREHGIAWPTYRWIYSVGYSLSLADL